MYMFTVREQEEKVNKCFIDMLVEYRIACNQRTHRVLMG